MNSAGSDRSSPIPGAIIAQGFAAAVSLWCAWYITHIPWLGLSESLRIPVLLVAWLAASIWAGAAAPRLPAVVGAGSGLVAALVGLLLVGTKLVQPAESGKGAGGLTPQASLMAVGFVGTGVAIGLLGGAIGGFFRRAHLRRVDWLGRFALVAAVSVAPLVFIGGLVTSTNSGMAVPDWPNTYGSNMFLYPLGPRIDPAVFFEHSHRLFGTLVGVTSIVLMIWTLFADSRRWVKVTAAVVLLLVVLQGVLGGVRVKLGNADPSRDLRILAVAHGVLAQLTFGSVVSLAVFLSPTFKRAAASPRREEIPGLRRLRFFTSGLLHSTILQLLLGAMYRHFRDGHSMWSHAGFSIVVLIFALLAGFAAAALPEDQTGIGRIIRRCGAWLLVVAIVQFLLGWTTLSLGGKALTAGSPAQALLRTCHQANGALLLAVAVAAFFWTRRLHRVSGGRAFNPGVTPQPA